MIDIPSRALGRVLIVTGLGLLLVLGGVTTVAQPATTTPTGTVTPTSPAPSNGTAIGTQTPGTPQPQQPPTGSTPTNSTDTTSNNGGILDWAADTIGGIGKGINNAIGNAQNMADSTYRASMDAVLGPLVTAMVEVPTFGIGLRDNLPGLHKPTHWPFTELYPLYIAIQGLTGSLLLLALTGGVAKLGSPSQNTYRTTRLIYRAFTAILIAVGAHLLLIAFLHTTVNELAIAIAPTTQEIAGDLGKVLTTTALSGVLGAGIGKDVIIQLAKLWTLIWAALMFFPIISPPFFALWQFNPKSTLGHFSGTLIWLYFGLLISKILVALDLRAAWMLEWGLGPLGILNGLLTIAFFWLALFIPPGVLIAILFGRSRALGSLSSATAGAVSGSYVGSKFAEKKQTVKDRVAPRAKEKGKTMKERAAKRTRSTAASARARVRTAAGTVTNNRVGHRRRPRDPSGETYSEGSSFTGWGRSSRSDRTSSDAPTGDETQSDGETATARGSSSASTKTTAEQIRNIKHRTRQRGYGTPADRRRYYDLRDQQKYGTEVDYQQASGAQRSTYRRYGSDADSTASASTDNSSTSRKRQQAHQQNGGDES